jgi:hypothetical protein
VGAALLCMGAASPSRAQFGHAALFGTGSLPQSVAVDDFNGDARADLATTDWGPGKIFGETDDAVELARWALDCRPFGVEVGALAALL